MFKNRSLTGLLVVCLGLASGVALFSAPVSAAGCTFNVSEEGIVDVQCPGGQADVKKAMKRALDEANAAGERVNGRSIECRTCHVNLTNFRLNEDAHELFPNVLGPYFE